MFVVTEMFVKVVDKTHKTELKKGQLYTANATQIL